MVDGGHIEIPAAAEGFGAEQVGDEWRFRVEVEAVERGAEGDFLAAGDGGREPAVEGVPVLGMLRIESQIKQRRSATASEIIYQVIRPKARAGEGVLLRQTAGQAASGLCFTPPDTVRALTASPLKEPLFGSDLTFADVLENFFTWQHQALVGTAVVDRVSCQILKSKPGSGQHSTYASVHTWVDLRRMVPLRIDKFLASGALARRIATTRVAADDLQHKIPAELTISGAHAESATELKGSRINHGVSYANATFTAEGLKDPSRCPLRARSIRSPACSSSAHA